MGLLIYLFVRSLLKDSKLLTGVTEEGKVRYFTYS